MTAPTDQALRDADDASRWKWMPHQFAEHASGGDWRPSKHLAYISAIIARQVFAGGGRIVVNMPARYGKSMFLSRWLPAWYLNLWPEKRIILGSYAAEIAQEHGGEVRNIARDNEFLNFRLSQDKKKRGHWKTNAGGGMICAGVGGGITGFGADLLLIDDPYKNWADAWSLANRQKVEAWFTSTAYKRLQPGGTIVVLHHRMHPNDLSGYLVEKHGDRWTHIRLPKSAERDDPLGRAEGEALWPEVWSQFHVEHEKAITPAHVWDAMDQQNPGAAAAGLAYASFGAANVKAEASLRKDLPLCVSFDFNLNPGMHCLVGQYDLKHDRFDVTHMLHGHRWTVEKILDEIKRLVDQLGGWQWPGLEVYGDATGGGTSMNDGHNSYVLIRQRVEKLTRHVRIRVPAGNPGVVDSLLTTNEALAGHVRIHPRCELLLDDLRRVAKDEDGGIDKSDTQTTHASDCLRYWVDMLRPLGGRKPQAKAKIGSTTGKVW